MMKQATFAETGAAKITIELVAVPNVIPAFAAFYGSIDELKHHTFRSSEQLKKERKGHLTLQQLRLSTVH